jgi:hypothetical protein
VAEALDPHLDYMVQLGNICGTAVPVVAIFIAGCAPEFGLDRVRLVLLVPMAICLADMLLLSLLHCRTSLFDSALQLLEEESCGAGNPIASVLRWKKSDVGANAGFFAVPAWIWYWIFAQAVGSGLDVSLFAMMAYFGDAKMTHELGLLALMAASCGRSVPLFMERPRWLDTNPMHSVIVACWYLRVLLGSLLVATLLHIFTPPAVFLQMIWFAFHFNSVMQASLTESTTVSSVPCSSREDIINASLSGSVASIVCGMGLAVWMIPRLVHADFK